MTAKMTPAARKTYISLLTSRIAFGAGVAVSLAANVVASQHTLVGVATGLWTPLAFLFSMALMENVQVRGKLGVARKIGMGFIAAIAGWASYWHLVEVATMGGADTLTAHLLPLTVDVMMALASAGMKRPAAKAPARKRPAARKTAPAKLKSVA